MRAPPLLLVVALLVGHAALAQPQDDGDDNEPAAASTPATAPAGQGEQATEQTDTPPLREEYEPRERISKDKAEAFPPDI